MLTALRGLWISAASGTAYSMLSMEPRLLNTPWKFTRLEPLRLGMTFLDGEAGSEKNIAYSSQYFSKLLFGGALTSSVYGFG